jgi:hypothetical protein
MAGHMVSLIAQLTIEYIPAHYLSRIIHSPFARLSFAVGPFSTYQLTAAPSLH